MNFPFFLARRYLFSKKSHSAINIISGISIGGVALSTMALVCVLSVFNGFRDLIGGLYSAFDPQLEIVPAKGKLADAADPHLQAARKVAGVEGASECLEENALILYKGYPLVVTVKGVDDKFTTVTGVDSIVYEQSGQHAKLPPLSAANLNYAVPGYGLAYRMGTNFEQLQLVAPRKGERINMVNPAESFNVNDIFSTGCYFKVSQRKYDDTYLLTSLDFARTLFEQEGKVSSLGLRLKAGTDEAATQKAVQQAVGSGFKVLNRMEQHEETFSVMHVEKLMAYIFLTFILLVASFNIIGSISMLIIDKRENAATLRALGATDRDVVGVFLFESRLITLCGAVIGVVLGLALCWAQQTFGFIRLGSSQGSFIVDAYPVSVEAWDVVAVFFTVIVVGFLTVWYPVKYLSRKLVENQI